MGKRAYQGVPPETFEMFKSQKIYVASSEKLKTEHFDYFVFGHRHLPLKIELNENSQFFNLGDWVKHFSYGVFDGKNFELKSIIK